MHAHFYVDNEPFRDRNVLVVGIGNSAMDIAVESSFVARRTLVSVRRGEHVMPKYLFGRPVDQIAVSPLTPLVPFAVRHAFFRALYRLAVGRVEDYGLPKPDHRLLESHPTLSADFLGRAAQGEIECKPAIAALQGDTVRFLDGSVESVDVIVWATGYRVSFPFFAPEFISAPDNELLLYRRVFKPGVDNLFFIGLLQPLGALMPLAEAQGRWVASYLRGEYALPPRREMDAEVRREHERMRRRYVASKRHTMEVDFDDYLFALRRELKAGARWARQDGFRLPVTPRAGAAVVAPSG
jgi:cation diffusion facilitator CzcD-associated flavoprotein CzcO